MCYHQSGDKLRPPRKGHAAPPKSRTDCRRRTNSPPHQLTAAATLPIGTKARSSASNPYPKQSKDKKLPNSHNSKEKTIFYPKHKRRFGFLLFAFTRRHGGASKQQRTTKHGRLEGGRYECDGRSFVDHNSTSLGMDSTMLTTSDNPRRIVIGLGAAGLRRGGCRRGRRR